MDSTAMSSTAIGNKVNGNPTIGNAAVGNTAVGNTMQSVAASLAELGLKRGDVVLVRAGLSAIGPIAGGDFLSALLAVVGDSGTVVSLAFTDAAYPWQAGSISPYTVSSTSYAGALPNAMIAHPQGLRSLHPQCSFVAIGRHARQLTAGHGPQAGAYEPVRKLMALNGKMLLVGCVASSPGFTTAHLAEFDLGLHRRRIAPWLKISRYIDEQGRVRTFRRTDPGLCSNSFWKFYAAYVRHGHLSTGRIGKAYAICAPAAACYALEYAILAGDSGYTICDSKDCVTCNLLRWDRLYRWPSFLLRRIWHKAQAAAKV